jgi:ACR3 family arsenite efflux pump ArsB
VGCGLSADRDLRCNHTQSDAQVDGQALAPVTVAVAVAVGLFGLAAAAAVRRGWRVTGLLAVAALFVFFVGCILPGYLT